MAVLAARKEREVIKKEQANEKKSKMRLEAMKKAGLAVMAAKQLSDLALETKEAKRAARKTGRELRMCCKSYRRKHLDRTAEAHPGMDLIANPWLTPTENIIVPASTVKGLAFRAGSLEPRYMGEHSELLFEKVSKP